MSKFYSKNANTFESTQVDSNDDDWSDVTSYKNTRRNHNNYNQNYANKNATSPQKQRWSTNTPRYNNYNRVNYADEYTIILKECSALGNQLEKIDDKLFNFISNSKSTTTTVKLFIESGYWEPLTVKNSKVLEFLKNNHVNGKYRMIDYAIWYKAHPNRPKSLTSSLESSNEQKENLTDFQKMFDIVRKLDTNILRKNSMFDGETALTSLLTAYNSKRINDVDFKYMYKQLTSSEEALKCFAESFTRFVTYIETPEKNTSVKTFKDYIFACMFSSKGIKYLVDTIIDYSFRIKTVEFSEHKKYRTIILMLKTLNYIITQGHSIDKTSDMYLFFNSNKYDLTKIAQTFFNTLQVTACNIDMNALKTENIKYASVEGQNCYKYNLRSIGALIGLIGGYNDCSKKWIAVYENIIPDAVATCIIHCMPFTKELYDKVIKVIGTDKKLYDILHMTEFLSKYPEFSKTISVSEKENKVKSQSITFELEDEEEFYEPSELADFITKKNTNYDSKNEVSELLSLKKLDGVTEESWCEAILNALMMSDKKKISEFIKICTDIVNKTAFTKTLETIGTKVYKFHSLDNPQVKQYLLELCNTFKVESKNIF